MVKLEAIIEALDDELINRKISFLTLAAANQLLVEKKIFTSDDIKNKTLKKILESDQIPHAKQTSHAPRQWRILLSDAGIEKQSKQEKIKKKRNSRSNTVSRERVPIQKQAVQKVICPGCNSILDIHKNILNSPRLICPICANTFKNPFPQPESTTSNKKIWRALISITILIGGIVAVMDSNSSDSSTYSNSSNFSTPSIDSPYNNDLTLNKLKKETNDLYNSLLEFKSEADFRLYGFGIGYKYNDWLIDIENLEKLSRQKQLYFPEFSIGDLKMLGLEYLKTQGKENEFTINVRTKLNNGLSE